MINNLERGVSAQAVANVFLELADDEGLPLTNMQVQKLVYIAHGFCLGALDRPLIHNNVHAWQFGPVIPSLYKVLQRFGNGRVTGRFEAENSVLLDPEMHNIVKLVWKNYKMMKGSKLSALTHLDGSPWDKTWNRDQNRFGVIRSR